jgi:hypothetical protein
VGFLGFCIILILILMMGPGAVSTVVRAGMASVSTPVVSAVVRQGAALDMGVETGVGMAKTGVKLCAALCATYAHGRDCHDFP